MNTLIDKNSPILEMIFSFHFIIMYPFSFCDIIILIYYCIILIYPLINQILGGIL